MIYYTRKDFWIHLFGFAILIFCGLTASINHWLAQSFVIVSFNFLGLIIEYEQKFQIGTNKLEWDEYFLKHAFSDITGNFMGSGIGFSLWLLLRGY